MLRCYLRKYFEEYTLFQQDSSSKGLHFVTKMYLQRHPRPAGNPPNSSERNVRKMKKIWKRSLSLFLAFVMVFGMLPVSTFADETEPVVTEETFAAEAVAAEVTETPAEEPTEPVTEAPVEETTVPATEAPVEETTVPVTETPVEITITQTVSDEAVNSEAEATEATEPELQWVTLDSGAYTGDFPSNDELFAAYADHIWFGTDIATFGTHAADRLNADTRTVYDALVPFLKDIAAGNRDSAMIAIGTSLNDTYKAEAEVTFDFNNLSAQKLLGALLADMPYEMYWQDKTLGISVQGASYDGIDWLYYFYFAVAKNYNTGNYEPFEFTDSEGNKYTKDICYTVDTTKIDEVKNTAAIAQSVVDDIAADADVKTDYDKLVAYKNWICQQVSYNQNAADGNPTFSENLDPWQVIYVFDGDPSTNVVCEGYSKAYQYLCDLTFSKADPAEETVTCYSVTGSLVGVGDHMWNIVEIDDNCYLADITNSDQGSAGENGSLFLVGGTADSNGVYTFSTLAQGGSSSFAYDEDTLDLWGDSGILTLSATNYEPPVEEEPEPPAETEPDDEMTQADLEAALTASSGSSYNLTKSVTLEENMTITLSDSPYSATFWIKSGGELIVPDGKTLTLNNRVYITGGTLTIQKGGKLVINQMGLRVTVSGGTLTVEDGAELVFSQDSKVDVEYPEATTINGTIPKENFELAIVITDETSLDALESALARDDYGSFNLIQTSTLELTRSFELPANATIQMQKNVRIVIPKDITMTVKGTIFAMNDGATIQVNEGGILLNDGGYILLADENRIENTGLVLGDDIYLQSGSVYGRDITEEEFRQSVAYMANHNGSFTLNGDLTLTGDLTINCNVRVAEGASLTVAEGAHLTVQNYPNGDFAQLSIDGEMLVQKGSTLEIVHNSLVHAYFGNVTIEDGVTLLSVADGETTEGTFDNIWFNRTLGGTITGINDSLLGIEFYPENAEDLESGLNTAGYAHVHIYINQDITLDRNIIVPTHGSVDVSEDSTLIVADGHTLTVNGDIFIQAGTRLDVLDGTKLVNNGLITVDPNGQLVVWGSFEGPGQVDGEITWANQRSSYLSGRWLDNRDGFWFENTEAEPDVNAGRGCSTMSSAYVIFYLNTWDSDNMCWNTTPVIPTASNSGAYTITKLVNTDEQIMDNQPNADYFVRVTVSGSLEHREDEIFVNCNDQRYTFDYHLWSRDLAFYTSQTATVDTIVVGHEVVLNTAEGAENAFYLIQNDDRIINDITWSINNWGDNYDTLVSDGHFLDYEEVVEGKIWKVTVDPEFVDYVQYDWKNFELRYTAEVKNPETGETETFEDGMWINPPELLQPAAVFGINNETYLFYDTGKVFRDCFAGFDQEGNEIWKREPSELKLSYIPAENRLILDTVDLTALSIHYGYSWTDENGNEIFEQHLPNENLTITLVGNSSIINHCGPAVRISNGTNVTINGNGSLYAKTTNYPDFREENGNHQCYDTINVHDGSSLTIGGDVTITAEVDGHGYRENDEAATNHAFSGSHQGDTLVITDNATVTTVVPNGVRHYDVTGATSQIGGYVGIENFNTITVSGGELNTDYLNFHDGGAFNLTDGVVNLRDIGCMEKHWQTGETVYHYEGIRTYGGSVNISGGELNIDVSPRDGESADQTDAYGINAIAGAIDISGGIININTGSSNGWAILADCDWTQDGWIDGTESYFSITGGTINILSDPRTYHGGILISEICGGYFGGGEINDDYGVHRFYGNTVWGDGENGGGTVLKGVATNVYTHGPGEFYMFDGQMDLIGDVFEENGETVTNRAIFEANGSGTLFGGKINLVNGSYRNNMNITLNGAEITINNDVADLPGLENYLYFPIYSGSLNITANGPAIINNGTFHQMGGEVYAESTLGTRPVMISTGRTLLNAGSLNLQGHGGVGLVQAYDFDLAADDIKDNESSLFMGAMDENQPCLNISGTQIGLYLNGPAVIVDGANVDIQVEGTPINADRDWPMAIYVEKHTGNLDLSGNNVSGLAISGGANVNLVSRDTAGVDAMSKGIVAWYAPVEIDGYTDEDTGAYIAPNVTIDAEMALYSMTDSAEASNLTISDDILSLTTGKKLEITGSAFEGGHLYSVKEDDDTYAGHVIITKAAVVSDLATLKSHMVEEYGRWVLTKPVTIEGSFALENIIIDVVNGGKLNIAEDVTLTISADSHLIAQENGTILVDGTIVNNGTMAADNGGIITFCSEESYVQGQQGSVLTVHYRNGSLSTIDGISLSHQTLHADVDSVDQIHYILGLENRAGYGKIDININTDMTLTSLTIPENVELFVNDATVTFTELIANYGGITSNFANGLVQIEGILNNYCSVNINNASTMEINGTLNNWQWFNVGYWKDASVEDTAGTLNINGTFNNYNYLNISPDAYIETEDRYCGGIVNVNKGGLLNNTFHQEKELYGFIELHGELNIHGTLMNSQQIVQYGSLYVYGNVDNGGSIRLFDKDFETGNDLELVTYEGAEIVNDTMIGNLSTNGVIVLAPDTYIQGSTNYDDGTSEPGELDAHCFDDLTMSRIEGAPEGTVSIFYEGSNADALLAAAELYKANRNAYDRCFLRVVGHMTIPEGMNLNLIPGSYLVVLNNGNTDPNMAPVYAGSLTVEGQIFNLGYIRLFGADMTIPQSGWITNKGIIDTNMMRNEKPTVTVGGLLENASTATLDLSNADFRLEEGGVMQNNLAGENLGDMIGVEISDQTLFSDIDSGDQAQLQQLIDKVQNDGYRHGCFWISSDLFILSNTVIPDNITLYIRPGVSLTNIDPGVILENNGRIIVEAGGQLDTNGNLYVKQEGIVDVYGSMTINAYGYVGLDANASLNVMNGGTLTVNGYFEVGEGTLNVAGGTVNNYATTVVSYPNGTVNGNVSRLILYMPINDAVDVEAKIQALQAYAQANGFAKTQIHFLCDYTFEAGFTVPQNMNLIIGAYGGEDRYTAATVTIPAGQTLTINGNVQVAQKSALILEDGAYLVCNGSIYAFGSCGTNATWVLSNDVLTISGSGDMFDYTEDSAPWAGCASLIKSVKIGTGITGIGDNAFSNVNVDTILVPRAVASVGENAFASGVTLKIYHQSAAESYAKANDNTIVYIHELDPETGACLYCDFGLEATLKDETKTTVEKVEEVKNTDTETLKTQIEQEIAQNTDGNSNTMDLIENLEKELLQDETTDLTVSAGVAENTDEVITTVFENVSDEAIVGAALNAAPDVSEVKLVISNPSGQNEVSEEYDTETGVLFSMTLEGVEDASTLDVPVKITLPVPAGINDLSKLVVLHYHDGQTEALNYTLSTGEDGKAYVTFLVSGFSDFAIVEEASTEIIPTFARSMKAFLTLESEVFLNVTYTFENITELDPSVLEQRTGLLIWDADQMPEEAYATYDNCPTILENGRSGQTKKQITYNGNESRMQARTDGIPAKEMGDSISFRAFYRCDDGTYIYGRIISNYSPKRYCYNMISDDQIGDEALMIAILNYGAAAQTYFKHNTDNLMNAELTAEQQALNWDGSLVRSEWSIPAAKEGTLTRNKVVFTSRGAFLSLLGAIDYNYYVRVSSDISVREVKMLTWTEENYNNADVLTKENATSVENAEYDADNNRYIYTYEGLAAKQMFSPIYACAMVIDESGNEYFSGVVAYCPERFGFINANNSEPAEAELAKRLVIYGDAARSFFG